MSTPSITEATTSAPNIQSLHPGFSIAGRDTTWAKDIAVDA